MACMIHECTNLKCGHAVFNNSRGPRTCPQCFSPMISSYDDDTYETPDIEDDFELDDVEEKE